MDGCSVNFSKLEMRPEFWRVSSMSYYVVVDGQSIDSWRSVAHDRSSTFHLPPSFQVAIPGDIDRPDNRLGYQSTFELVPVRRPPLTTTKTASWRSSTGQVELASHLASVPHKTSKANPNSYVNWLVSSMLLLGMSCTPRLHMGNEWHHLEYD